MLAVFELPCCQRFIVSGRYKGSEIYPPTVVCQHGKRNLRFAKYVDERRLARGIKTHFLTKTEERDLCLKTSSATS